MVLRIAFLIEIAMTFVRLLKTIPRTVKDTGAVNADKNRLPCLFCQMLVFRPTLFFTDFIVLRPVDGLCFRGDDSYSNGATIVWFCCRITRTSIHERRL